MHKKNVLCYWWRQVYKLMPNTRWWQRQEFEPWPTRPDILVAFAKPGWALPRRTTLKAYERIMNATTRIVSWCRTFLFPQIDHNSTLCGMRVGRIFEAVRNSWQKAMVRPLRTSCQLYENLRTVWNGLRAHKAGGHLITQFRQCTVGVATDTHTLKLS